MVTDAYEQGRLAHRNNHPMSSCKYPAGSSLRAQWMDGWTQARNAAPKGEPHAGMMADAGRARSVGQPDSLRG